ncbi:AMP-dependent synthetase/ligase [Microvirga pudoricolor]|uniref:AMP-dependent synthetase/ligase n=1 Tax=Microvirga pudoricolor TaxID=2778729 RepID=UPI00194DF61F|nr:AMP-binding protein [Microvirga pudoricolor]MBM6592609.1 AMP-binding protein [Microvirga pudoricolor]
MPEALSRETMTLPQLLRDNAERMPDRIALRQKDFGIWQPITWAEYEEKARHFGLGLLALGMRPRGHVAILSENRAEWVIAQLGTGLVGGVAIGVYATSPANEVAYVLAHSDAEIVVCEDQEQTDKILECLDELPAIKRIVVIDPKGLRHYASDRLSSFAEVVELGTSYEKHHPDWVAGCLASQTPEDLGLMVYTSGSTGKPKGAMLSYRNMTAQSLAIIERLGFTASTTNLSYLPLCHVAEQMLTVMTPLRVGSCVSFGESIRTVQEDLREVAPSLFLGVPRIWEKLHSSIHIKMIEAKGVRRALFEKAMALCEPFAEKAPRDRSLGERVTFALCYALVFRSLQNFIGLRKCQVALTGAAPISPSIVRFFRTLGVPLVEVYGLTETSGMVTGQRLDALLPGAVGPAAYGAEVKLGDHGELLVRGGMVFEGYYSNEEATRASIRDGWLHTGDVAAIESGQVRIVDRLKDIMITAGGKNLSPSEIENTVKGSAFIKECIVIAEGRRFPTALLQIDAETAGKWAEENRVPFTNFKSLAEHDRVRELIAAEIERANRQLGPVAQIKKFHLLTKELDHDDDEVTATMKVRRSNIYRKYAAEIEALYGAPAVAAE